MKNQFIIVKTTFAKNQKSHKLAKNLVKILIEKKLAACVQISEIESFYSWENEILQEKEFLLEIKSKKTNFAKIEQEILKNHNYENPQIISVEIQELSQNYKNYLNSIIS